LQLPNQSDSSFTAAPVAQIAQEEDLTGAAPPTADDTPSDKLACAAGAISPAG
jgi:hypothetical protein